ncbi:MAG: primosomal protein N', partial [Proteocatella sp.]
YMSNNTMSKKVEVAIKHKSRYVDRLFTYLAPDEIKLGHRVEVPFGKGNKLHEALVINIINEDELRKKDYGAKIITYKEIISIKDQMPIIKDSTMNIARWMKEQYMCSFFEALSLFLPKSEKTAVKYRRILVPVKSSEEIAQYKEKQRKNAKNKILLLEELIKGPVDIMEMQDTHKIIFSSVIKQLCEDEVAVVEKEIEYRIPKNEYHINKKDITLTQEQENAYYGISKNLLNGKLKLLHGITGSGKTEVYIKLIEDAIEAEKSAILLVPEISLTPQTIARFKNIFGKRIALLHSHLSEGEKKDQWDIIEKGSADIVIGARSAIFAPLKNLGIIIIDECHDDAYKSEQNPKYDTVELAEKMMENYGVSVVIGTATPTIEQYYKTRTGDYDLFKLKNRVNAKLPEIEIIDTIDELRHGNISFINSYIKSKIQKEIDDKRQVIIFLNKRGFANSLTCLDCGHTIKCPNCDITMNYHKNGNKLLCHYCGHTEKYDRICKECGSSRLKEIGMGTQKIEEEITASISGADIVRLDRDTTLQKGNHEKLLNKFKEKQANILIGTQMISKGLDFEDVTLVVVLNADQSLRFPDYRSYEKTFSTVSQVAGRA